jgi:hypothetical protein
VFAANGGAARWRKRRLVQWVQLSGSFVTRSFIDIDLKSLRGQSHSFTHTKYWDIDGEPIHIDVLRTAVNLLDRPGDPLAGARVARAD